MLSQHGVKLPHSWIPGDDEMGHPAWFRLSLAALGEHYLLSAASNRQIWDLAEQPLEYDICGRHSHRFDEKLLVLGGGLKDTLIVEVLKRLVATRTEKRLRE